jgi:3D (Asp-Asp-Asp) domain-containing protein
VGSHDDEDSGEDSEPESSDEPATAGGTVLDGTAKTVTAHLTGYSYFDNNPPGSADICCPKLHQKAGGTGTHADPITTAVPGSGGQGMETPAGTRLYVAKLKRYFIVEDSGASGSGYRFDLWVGGQGFDESASEQCMSEVTGDTQAILNPVAGLPVTVGPLTSSSGCNI